MALEAENVMKMAKKPKMLRKWLRSPICLKWIKNPNAKKIARKPKILEQWLRSPKC